MADKKVVKRIAGTSDEALKAKTGKQWEEWFDILDQAGAMEMDHPEIARTLSEQYGVSGWWSQKITGGYEQERKGRQKHQMPEGYQVGASKTVEAPISELFSAWNDGAKRSLWLDETGIQVRSATPQKSARFAWVDGKSRVEVLFTPKGARRSQVNVQHNKLLDASEAEKMKRYWGEALERLKEFLEGPAVSS